MITKLDGTPVDTTALRTKINRKIKSVCVGRNGETFADIVIQSIAARQADNAPLRPCDLQWDLTTKTDVRSPTIRRRVEVWSYLVDAGIADARNSYLVHNDEAAA